MCWWEVASPENLNDAPLNGRVTPGDLEEWRKICEGFGDLAFMTQECGR